MFNEMIVVSITPFSGTSTPDKNGKMPVMLQLLAGRMPNRNVLSGTVAERMGIEIGKTYLVNVRETGFDKLFGPDYTFVKVKELVTGSDIIQTVKDLNSPELLIIKRPDGFEEKYERKGDAIESIKTKRIKEGLYQSVSRTSVDHKTASNVKDGSSVENGKGVQ